MSLSAALDYLGTFTFAFGGASVAVRRGTDLFGVAVIALLAGTGGGVLRDVLLGHTPPRALGDATYLLLSLAATGVVVAAGAAADRVTGVLVVLDALGLAFFATAGALIALQAGTAEVTAVVLGTITAVGGGILRDLLTNRMPAVLHSEIYATAALVAATLLVAGLRAGLPQGWAVALGVICGAGLRVIAWRAGWRLAVPRS